MFDWFNYSNINGVILISDEDFNRELLDLGEIVHPDDRSIILAELQHLIKEVSKEKSRKVYE